MRLDRAQETLDEFLDPRNPGAMEAVAILALAEEQRTANLIAYLPHIVNKDHFERLQGQIEFRLSKQQ